MSICTCRSTFPPWRALRFERRLAAGTSYMLDKVDRQQLRRSMELLHEDTRWPTFMALANFGSNQ